MRAGEGRQQRRVGVDHPATESLEECGADELHEAGTDDEVRGVRGDRVGQGPVPGGPVVALAQRDDEGGDPRGAAPLQPVRALAVGPDGHHPDVVGCGPGGVGAGIEQGLQQGARAGHEDDNRERHGGQPTQPGPDGQPGPFPRTGRRRPPAPCRMRCGLRSLRMHRRLGRSRRGRPDRAGCRSAPPTPRPGRSGGRSASGRCRRPVR
ncbi:hypothetical protein SDC9_169965 [bioreactor metagenome]|uniref:Uncharacterized protein n=1 Tax=bioreactor metagenome TaxID=1076179 RepID=A0A645G9C9_9ZZZZ